MPLCRATKPFIAVFVGQVNFECAFDQLAMSIRRVLTKGVSENSDFIRGAHAPSRAAVGAPADRIGTTRKRRESFVSFNPFVFRGEARALPIFQTALRRKSVFVRWKAEPGVCKSCFVPGCAARSIISLTKCERRFIFG